VRELFCVERLTRRLRRLRRLRLLRLLRLLWLLRLLRLLRLLLLHRGSRQQTPPPSRCHKKRAVPSQSPQGERQAIRIRNSYFSVLPGEA
jgi:hypothetical protein